MHMCDLQTHSSPLISIGTKRVHTRSDASRLGCSCQLISRPRAACVCKALVPKSMTSFRGTCAVTVHNSNMTHAARRHGKDGERPQQLDNTNTEGHGKDGI